MRFSIIIPAFNSEKYIKACLDSIFHIDYPDYEIIIVDGGSTDNTINIIRNYNIKLIQIINKSISNSRNTGAKQAKGDALVFIDSDCIVNKDLLKKSEEYLKAYACCGSFYKPDKDAGWVAKTWLLIEKKKKGTVEWIPSGTLIVKRTIFDEIDGFNEKLITAEDFDFCQRLNKKGYKIFNDPEIASIHIGQTDNIKDFFKKEMWRGNSLIKSIKVQGIRNQLFSTIITFYHLLAIIFLIIASFITMRLFVISILALFIPSLLLGIRKTIQTKKISYFFHFFILISIYQIARAVSIIRYNQFKDLV